MAGVYIHIPFCKQKCHYCNFFSLATRKFRDEFIPALKKEIISRSEYIGNEEVTTIYFGGGTPSLLSGDQINQVYSTLENAMHISPGVEVTLEANPDDISKEWIQSIVNTPVNRLSLGVQSFFDEDLAYLNRVHDSGQAIQSIEIARDAGYSNLTLDLIYGIPGLTIPKWQRNLEIFFSLEIPHLSAYALTVEPRTALHQLIKKNKLPAPDEQEGIDHFRLLQKLTHERGYVHYEISNFSLPGHYSRHNSIYWLGGNYLGLGPSAHSYNGNSRTWNASNLGQYIKNSGEPEKMVETEHLTIDQRYNEYVMTSLRTSWGCDGEHILNVFGKDRHQYFLLNVNKFLQQGWVRMDGNIYRLTNEGKLFADGISSELFADEAIG
jgi:oxygen-independent coproporphyrinogen-3 oxidase